MIPSRRSFLIGGAALLAAPAIVRVASLMSVSVPRPTLYEFRMEARRGANDYVTQTSFHPSFDDAIASFSGGLIEPDQSKWKVRSTGRILRPSEVQASHLDVAYRAIEAMVRV